MYAAIVCNAASDKPLLHEIAARFSPIIEEAGDCAVIFNIDGNELLIGSLQNIAKAISEAAVDSGLILNIAIAQNPDAALCSAQFRKGITVITAGDEAKYLDGLPIEALHCSLRGKQINGIYAKRRLEEIVTVIETLKRWGIHRFHGFIHLSEADVSERLGTAGVELHGYARGIIERPLSAKDLTPPFSQMIELDHPIDLLEPLSFILFRLIGQLCDQVKAAALAVQELRLCLKLQDKTEYERTMRLPFPTLDEKTLLNLLLLRIKNDPPEAAVDALSITAESVKPRVIQPGLFERAAPQPEKLQLTIARIEKLVGAENVGSPALLDTHRPDAFTVNKFEVVRKAQPTIPVQIGLYEQKIIRKTNLGFRIFRPPIEADVRNNQGHPSAISTKEKRKRIIVKGSVVTMAGPWRVSGEWWQSTNWERDEWDVALSDGNLYRVFHDLQRQSWFIEGIYD